MKLHRLALTNYRGITHRDIEFPDHGVVIVSGANEIGKTSMLEALDLLLEAKDRSTKKEVKQVKPTHADVGAEVIAEISTGPYRFVYRKRFHKRAETELTLLAPRREQLTGDEAHDRVRAMLAETVDMDLWQAQRVLQSASTSEANLSGCNALSRALDVVAGEIDDAAAGAVDTLLIDRIDEEYRRYFTSTGRPTGEWAAAVARLRAADEDVATCAAAMAEVDEAVRRHATLTGELAALAIGNKTAAQRLAAARADADAVARLSGELHQATVLADAAKSTYAASMAALTERRRARADVDQRVAAIDALQAVSDAAAEDLATGTEVQTAADEAALQARSALEACQLRVEAVRRAVQRLADRDEADRLAGRISTIETHQREFDAVQRELAPILLTARQMLAIESAAGAVDSATAAVEQASAHIELLAAVDLEVVIGGDTVALRAGDTWSSGVSGPAGVDVAGVLSLQVTPGAPAATTRAALDTAQEALTAALGAVGVADVAAARMLDERRRGLATTRDRLRTILDVLTTDDSVDDLRSRLSALQAAMPADGGLWDAAADGPQEPAALRAELDALSTTHRRAARDAETHRRVAEEAVKVLTERGLRAARAKEKLQAAQAELRVLAQRLVVQRETAADDELAVKVEADADTATKAQALAGGLADELARHRPEAVAAALDSAERDAAAIQTRHEHATEALREVTTKMNVYGTEGRKGRLDAAETEREHAEGEHRRVQGRARAAHLLRTVMGRHRDAQRLRYVDPFRGEVERLGRIVFGESFEVDVDSELRIGHRTLSGRTVPYESLSGGAKEQLGIVARLAGAAMVAKEDSVPVVIDDALGFTDAERLTKMAEVFEAVGGDNQVIILTCSPQRYAGIRCAYYIELVA